MPHNDFGKRLDRAINRAVDDAVKRARSRAKSEDNLSGLRYRVLPIGGFHAPRKTIEQRETPVQEPEQPDSPEDSELI